MKIFKIIFFSLLISSFGVFAQTNGNYMPRNYGVNRDVARSYSGPTKPTQEEIEKGRTEKIEKIMTKLKNDLTLDELQVIAIRNEITSNSKNIDIVLKKETSEEEKTNEVKALMDKSEMTINSYLNKEQKEKYKAFMEEFNNPKKDKKDKKKEKKTEE